ncbi:hypothetical protein [Microbacterium sp. Marseille-Q6965]|uniref:hypothetical protein n=1 Tax=Microbacterium sp. Marseille-Q6965 TaxID=2965072 RepID=UPI0021B74864|nr:hypothetical protein [Microbacterium sp. Marseille-Q6965]
MSLDELLRVGLLLLPLLGALAGAIWVVVVMNSSVPLERKYGQSSSGAALFNEAFHPSAANALKTWEQDKRTIVPAPSPDKGPGIIDVDKGTIRLDIAETATPNTPEAAGDRAPHASDRPPHTRGH